MSEKEVSDLLKKIFTPVLLGLGILGNVISIIIFSKASLIKHTTFKYLLLLSILDLCVLISGCGSIFLEVYFDLNVRHLNNFSCKLHSFMVIFFTHSSSMLLVCMSVDRVLVIKMKKGSKISNPKMASRVFWFLLIFIGILNIHFLLFNQLISSEKLPNDNDSSYLDVKNSVLVDLKATTLEPINATQIIIFNVKNYSYNQNYLNNVYKNHNSRQSSDENNLNDNKLSSNNSFKYQYCYATDPFYYGYLTEIFPWVDLFFYVIFPSTVMLICSIIIISKIFSTSNRLSAFSNTISRKRAIKNRQISYLLLTTNLVFFLLVSPLLVLNNMSLIEENTIRTTVVYLLNYSNHGLNFIFYGITCQKYRSELFNLINGIWSEKSNTNDQKYELVTSVVNDKRRMTQLLDQE
ncbi:unnamed protein product [Brachionus calyciflorus]|uniref:G-protein coupled receptors family 1 profile domain-containing protein n=1 Tax=Brachionus calyciflorus TaxID=104777 RepID=A0A813NCR2_9BILA|nr:unnamed protein product [Brachionus calyciflorus]